MDQRVVPNRTHDPHRFLAYCTCLLSPIALVHQEGVWPQACEAKMERSCQTRSFTTRRGSGGSGRAAGAERRAQGSVGSLEGASRCCAQGRARCLGSQTDRRLGSMPPAGTTSPSRRPTHETCGPGTKCHSQTCFLDVHTRPQGPQAYQPLRVTACTLHRGAAAVVGQTGGTFGVGRGSSDTAGTAGNHSGLR